MVEHAVGKENALYRMMAEQQCAAVQEGSWAVIVGSSAPRTSMATCAQVWVNVSRRNIKTGCSVLHVNVRLDMSTLIVTQLAQGTVPTVLSAPVMAAVR